MKSILQTLRSLEAPFLLCAPMLGALFCSACTVSNDKDGGTDGVIVPERNDRPSPESFALWADPGQNLLAALAEVEAHDATTVLAARNAVLGVVLNEAGAYNSAALAYQPNNTPYRPRNMQCMTSVLPDAVEEICRALLNPDLRLVFIDDSPNFAQHRTLGRSILPCAREAGFEHLVIESLEETGEALAARGFVSRTQSGRFLREPQLAGLVEDGLRLGFVPTGLPHTEFCADCPSLNVALGTDARVQATSLEEKLASWDPAAKVLVWTAIGQAYKQSLGKVQPYVNTLASYVFADTGIEPYSLIQITVDAGTSWGPVAPSGMYLASGPNGSCSGSYSPGASNGKSTHNGVVFHVPPRPGAKGSDAERWEWLHTAPDQRMAVTPACSSCASDERLLVQAFPVDVDLSDRVPVDQALCLAGSTCQLAMPAGAYQLVVWSESAQLTSKVVTVAAGTTATVNMN